MVPKRNSETIRHIEFVPLSATRVLTVIVTSAGEILNRLIETSREFSRSELEQFSKIVFDMGLTAHGGLDVFNHDAEQQQTAGGDPRAELRKHQQTRGRKPIGCEVT